MTAQIDVTVVGGTGQTGSLIVDGLLASGANFRVTTLTRASSFDSTANQALRDRGVTVLKADLKGPKQDLVDILKGVDIVVAAVYFTALRDQINLASAAKEAGVGRFVPCHFGTPGIRGINLTNDIKLDVLDEIYALHLPYTVIDVGWWSQEAMSAAPLPSGRTNHCLLDRMRRIPGDGNVKCAFTSTADIGSYVAQILIDPRTLNHKVFAYTDVLTYNEVVDIIENESGELTERIYKPAERIYDDLAAAKVALEKNPEDWEAKFNVIMNQYYISYGLRGDNTPWIAKYLGYLDVHELYPDFHGETMSTVVRRTIGQAEKT